MNFVRIIFSEESQTTIVLVAVSTQLQPSKPRRLEVHNAACSFANQVRRKEVRENEQRPRGCEYGGKFFFSLLIFGSE